MNGALPLKNAIFGIPPLKEQKYLPMKNFALETPNGTQHNINNSMNVWQN